MDDTRNVIDRYKGWTTDLIRNDLNQKLHPFAVLMENWQGDFNFSTLVRNANAHAAEKIFYLGKKKWDRRGALGAYIYSTVTHFQIIEQLIELKQQYTFIGVDNINGSVPMPSFVWPDRPLLLFGEEGAGLTQPVIELCDAIVEVPMFGSIRSLNAGTASGIAMYDLVTKYKASAR